ncbi:MAG: formylmethanofuran dehydrogenase [Chloroflexi bacterium]|nr:MAG: formylmethanofuran dehydrogenase [Chloroflexota bacterium]
MTDTLTSLLEQSAGLHSHLCPRQVLGVRMGLLAGKLLGLELPQPKKRLLTIVETDGCFADGVSTATNCWVGRRTLRVVDFGKVAATFVDTRTETAVRLHPLPQIRELAPEFAPEARNRWEGYLLGYQRMPDHLMFGVREVALTPNAAQLMSRAGVRVNCDLCGEEIINEREVMRDAITLCQTCAGNGYYALAPEGTAVALLLNTSEYFAGQPFTIHH